jgi:hypothetical protein
MTTMSVEAAAQALREATREVVRRYSTWFIQGVLMVLAGIVALICPFVSTVALVVVLGWLLILSGIVQGISLIGAQNVPNGIGPDCSARSGAVVDHDNRFQRVTQQLCKRPRHNVAWSTGREWNDQSGLRSPNGLRLCHSHLRQKTGSKGADKKSSALHCIFSIAPLRKCE